MPPHSISIEPAVKKSSGRRVEFFVPDTVRAIHEFYLELLREADRQPIFEDYEAIDAEVFFKLHSQVVLVRAFRACEQGSVIVIEVARQQRRD